MQRVQSGLLVSLGYGRFVRSDEVVAIEPIEQGRGPRRRTYVWVRGLSQPLVASRSEAAIAADLLADGSGASDIKQLRATLARVAEESERALREAT
jgi:hypothetical protein